VARLVGLWCILGAGTYKYTPCIIFALVAFTGLVRGVPVSGIRLAPAAVGAGCPVSGPAFALVRPAAVLIGGV